jgi:hypothetical protein
MIPFKLLEFNIANQEDLVSGVLSEHQQILSLSFRLNNAHNFQLPPQLGEGERRKELWKLSCFEVFIRPNNSEHYVEFNLSPEGHWNAFEFDGYRSPSGLENLKEVDLTNPPMLATTGVPVADKPWRLDSQIDLRGLPEKYLIPGNRMIGVSAVLLDTQGKAHFFALNHPAPKADFHDPKSHTLRL